MVGLHHQCPSNALETCVPDFTQIVLSHNSDGAPIFGIPMLRALPPTLTLDPEPKPDNVDSVIDDLEEVVTLA